LQSEVQFPAFARERLDPGVKSFLLNQTKKHLWSAAVHQTCRRLLFLTSVQTQSLPPDRNIALNPADF